MCGRFSLHHTPQQIAFRFSIEQAPAPRTERYDIAPERYNIAPTEQVAVVRQLNGSRLLDELRWGLIPSWSREPAMDAKLINARAETVAERPAFKGPLVRRRCLVPADGFYEWRHDGKARLPFYFRRRDSELFGFAGLWDEWRSPDGQTIQSCTLITCAPNTVLEPVHNRMPVMLRPDDEGGWLDPHNHDVADLLARLRPYPAEEMEGFEVSARVNRAGVEGPSLILPL
jgi:putative SOS response-associated peptidase YedK